MEFDAIFQALADILRPYQSQLDCTENHSKSFYLNTQHIMNNKKPLFFASVAIKKNYVSFHLMPVYVNPRLLEGITSELKKRMQGKSCFNFKSVDKQHFVELKNLTAVGFEDYRAAGYI